MWSLLQNKSGEYYGYGTVCEVWINEEEGLIKRYFKPDGITISGKPVGPENPPERVKELFENEKYWLEKLKIIFILFCFFYMHIINDFTIIKSKFELKSINLLNFLNAI